MGERGRASKCGSLAAVMSSILLAWWHGCPDATWMTQEQPCTVEHGRSPRGKIQSPGKFSLCPGLLKGRSMCQGRLTESLAPSPHPALTSLAYPGTDDGICLQLRCAPSILHCSVGPRIVGSLRTGAGAGRDCLISASTSSLAPWQAVWAPVYLFPR